MNTFKEINSRYPVFNWISNAFFYSIDVKERSEAQKLFFKVILKWTKNNGPVYMIRRIKIIRNLITRYIVGDPILVNHDHVATTDGFPKAFIGLRKFIDDSKYGINGMRFVLTQFGITRSLRVRGKVDLSSVTKPFTGNIKTIPIDFIQLFVKDFNINIMHDGFSLKSLFFTLKSGIYGKQMWSAFESFKDWNGTMMACARIILSTSVDELFQLYRSSAPYLLKTNVKDKLLSRPLRRLSIVSDPEQKERVICIFDYFTQVVFEPLSQELFRILKSLDRDRTFTQDPIIKNKRDTESKYYSFDLSAATDRFPIELQVDLLAEATMNRSYADAWKILMVKQRTIDHNGNPIAYAVGQPMGARSSWAMFTQSHHLTVQYSAYLAGCYPTDQYILLGDDIVIYDDKVSKQYQKQISDLGVEISPIKSHVSKDTYEFAKRWFRNGIEFSPIPMNGIFNCINNPIGLFMLIRTYIQRGYWITQSCSEATADLLIRMGKPHWKTRVILNRLEQFNVVIRNAEEFNYDEIRNFIANATSGNDYWIPSSERDLRQEYLRVVNAQLGQRLTSQKYSFSKYSDNCYNTQKGVFFQDQTPDSVIINHPVYKSLENSFEDINLMGIYRTDVEKINLKETQSTLTFCDPELVVKGRKYDVANIALSTFAFDLKNQFKDFWELESNRVTLGHAAMSLKTSRDGFRKIREKSLIVTPAETKS